MTVNWHSIILSKTWLARLEKQANKRFGQGGLAQEATTYALEQLADNNWAKCHTYTGKAKPETFLYTLTNHLLEEFARKRFGRPRPPQWLQREGDLWLSVWKMVCLERQLVESVIDRLVYQGDRQQVLITAIIKTIKAKLPWCGSSNREIPQSMVCSYGDDNEEVSAENTIETDTLEQQLDQNQLDENLLIISQLFSFLTCPSNTSTYNDNHISDNDSDNQSKNVQPLTINQAQLNQLQQAIQLTSEEQLLLNMVYQQGLKLNVVAKALNIPSYQPGRLLKGLLQRIEQALVTINLPMAILKGLIREAQ
jgi:DNA-directed RNA polymerase specialized sigma24 family protein